MNSTTLHRIGAAAAVLGVAAWLAAAVLMPIVAILDESPAAEARALADATGWDATWLVHLASVVLIVGGLAVVGRTFTDGPAREWARVGDVLLAITGAVAAAAVLVSAGLKELADTWAAAAPASQEAALAAFDATRRTWVYLDLGGSVAVGLYLATLAAAVLSSRVYARWIGWAAALAAPLMAGGVVVELRWAGGTAANLVGALLVIVVLVALAVSMWRRAGASAGQPVGRSVPAPASRGAAGS
jgi:hypothetical protein